MAATRPAFTATPATKDAYTLGEGPVWDPERQRLLWVDIAAGAVHEGRLDPAAGTVTPGRSWSFAGTVGAVAVAADGSLLVAERAALTHIDVDGRRTEIARVLPPGHRSRLNDGVVDPAGRFVVGSMALDDRRGEEILVRLDDGGLVTLDTDLTLSNGLAWSPAGDRFYSVDTIPGNVWEREYNPASGSVGERRMLFEVRDGSPDGLRVDAEGNLWVAIWGRGRVDCFTPAGEVVATVAVSAPHTSCVAFAGPDLDVLVITTAASELSSEDRTKYPDSGRLFSARVGVRGLPATYWRPPPRSLA